MEKELPRIKLYTDGAYSRSYKVGGYAYLLKYNEHELSGSGCIENTTSNRMEILGVIEGLKKIKNKNSIIYVISDSTYVVDTMNKWIYSFVKDSTRKNHDLMVELYNLMKQYSEISAEWIKGHSGNKYNEIVNDLAQAEVKKYKERIQNED